MFRALAAMALFATLTAASFAQAAPPPVEVYGKLPAIDMVRLSPSGERYAFIAGDGAARRLYVATASNQPIEARDVGSTKIRDIRWAGEDHLLITASSTVDLGMMFLAAKDELTGVIVLNLTTHKLLTVFGGANQTKVARAVFGDYGAIETAGHWYGYFGGLTYTTGNTHGFIDHGYADLYRVDLDTGEFKRVADGDERNAGWLVGPSGEVAARESYNEATGDWRIATGPVLGRELASGHSAFGRVPMAWGRTPDSILINRRSDDDGTQRLQELSLSGGAPVDVADGRKVSDLIFDPATRLLIGMTAESDEREASFFAPGAQVRLRGARKAFPGYFVHLSAFSADLSRMVVQTEGGDDSGTYWIVNVAKHSAHPIGGAYPLVTAGDVGPVRMVSWRAADGLALSGVLTTPPGRPATAPPPPLIVLPHGGPELRDYPGFDWWAQAFASRGYAVFQPNFRGSDGYGAGLRDAGFGEWGRKMQTDISDGVAALAAQKLVDPKRACIVGASYGGYAALAGVTIQQGLYRCAVSVAGVADPRAMLVFERDEHGGPTGATRYWKAFMGAASTDDPSLKSISPTDLAARADAPILLIHGKDDTVVPIAQSQAMARALKAAARPVDLVIMPGEDHWLSHEATRTLMLRATIDFVTRNNPPDADPAGR